MVLLEGILCFRCVGHGSGNRLKQLETLTKDSCLKQQTLITVHGLYSGGLIIRRICLGWGGGYLFLIGLIIILGISW